jgi:hypothetical protein
MLMSSESVEPSLTRPAIDAIVHDDRAPGQEARPPEPADARLKAAVFSQPETEKQPPSVLGLAAAGMLVHDLVQESFSRRHDEDEEDDEDNKQQPQPPE